MMEHVAAIIVAAGTGTRMGTLTMPKQFLRIGNTPILAYTLKRFDAFAIVNTVVLVARAEDREPCETLLREHGIRKVAQIVSGGKERQDSVYNGLLALERYSPDIVLIHDAVRMFVSEDIIERSIADARNYGASVVAVPAKDTIKTVAARAAANSESASEALFVEKTLDRNILWQMQTPQTFQYSLIASIHRKAKETGIYGTDDAMLAEHFGYSVKIVRGSYRNIKITTPDDLLIAEAFLRAEAQEQLET